MGIRLIVVQQDLENGREVLVGKAPVSFLRTHYLGGFVDEQMRVVTAACGTPRYWDGGGDPVTWYCSEAQELLLIGSPELATKILCYGAMGAGKTAVLARWLIVQALALCVGCPAPPDVAIGAVAPTRSRRDLIVKALKSAVPAGWYDYRKKDSDFVLSCGVAIELRAAKAQSSDTGTPIAGQTWAACARDEGQDQTDAHDDVEMRGRGAPKGIYRELVTCTAKGTSKWKRWRDERLKSPNWCLYRLEYWSNVFVFPKYWEELKHDLSERGWILKVLAQDVAPEKAIYIAFNVDRNLIAFPPRGAQDVTRHVLRHHGPNFTVLGGHDPGVHQDVTILLKAFKLPGRKRHVWVAFDEIITRRTTSEQHAKALKTRLRNKWGVQMADTLGERALLRCDPHGQRDNRPHTTVYTEFRNEGFTIMSAAYTKKAVGSGWIPLKASIEMMNRLFHSASELVRLYLGTEYGRVMTPRLQHCLEMAEWDDSYEKQAGRKDDKDDDVSDPPDATRIAMWPYEKTRRLEQDAKQETEDWRIAA